ncbi:hypothetical protein GCM10023144_41030 [Pigmentiphaga soli]|uniref:RcnB family protein n=1 Tax=Pigmentiphaga soli TaxID=1007095 RepID=A0ABP8HLE8_9BURK
MIKQTLAVILAAGTMALAPAVHADGPHRGGHGGGHWHGQGHGPGPGHYHGPGPRWSGGRHWSGPPAYAYRPPAQVRWVRGARLPPVYRERYYVVNDWHARRLYRPAPGYQWVQVGADYLLVAIASGVIANIILSSR